MEENNSKKRILVVEDEKTISKVLEINLLMAGYMCDTAFDGEEGLQKAQSGNYDLILLDIMLPKRDGFSVCREVRKTLSTPIIMVTAKEEEIDKVMGLDLGADDYVTKPFSIKVLLARIKANIRRSSGEVVEFHHPVQHSAGTIVIRGLVIDPENFRVEKDGKEIELTRKEFEVLLILASSPGKLFSREELLEKVWGYEDFFGGIRTVDVTMSRLRSKVEDQPAEPEYILTKRTKGYYIPA
ncbi:MAG: response regulator transcription factor [Clostridia bacterium]|nr:response regulator transcription factor [Clostridia bacterium]